MAETATPNRRWNSFVCPTCRFIFRVAQDHDGQGVVCPGCRVMLRLPAEDAQPGPLMLEREDEHDYEEAEEAAIESRGRNLTTMAFAGGTAVVALGIFAWWMMPDRSATRNIVPSEEVPAVVVEAPSTPATTTKTDLAEIDAVTRSFLEAESIEELKPWIREAEATFPKIAPWLGDEPYRAPGFRDLGSDIKFFTRDNLNSVTVPVRTRDRQAQVTLVKEAAGWRVDWESWAGWSEMSWEEFRSTKPTEPKLFRVKVFTADYYNFGFKDELEWRSYRLDSADGEDSLTGYAERGGDIDVRMDPREVTDGKRMLVKLKFPAESPAGNQVLVDSIVAEDWLDSSSAPAP